MRRKFVASMAGLVLALGWGFVQPMMAQSSQTPSVAEAARQAKAQKNGAAKPAVVITDDTFAPGGTTNTIGGAPPVAKPGNTADGSPAGTNSGAPAVGDAASTANGGGETKSEKAGQETGKDEKEDAHITALKQEVADLEKEVDVSKRELALDNDTYYSKTDYASDKDGKAKLDAVVEELKQKQDDVAKLKAKLLEELSKSGGDTTAPKP